MQFFEEALQHSCNPSEILDATVRLQICCSLAIHYRYSGAMFGAWLFVGIWEIASVICYSNSKQRRRSHVLLVTLLALGAGSAALAATEIDLAMAEYKKGSYSSAAQYFQAAIQGQYFSDAMTHYYLADCLVRTRKTQQAMVEYERSLSLAPTGPAASYCKQMLARLRPPETPQIRVSSVGAASPLLLASPRVPLALPVPKRAERDGPSLATISAWSDSEKVGYYNEAVRRKQLAHQQLEEALAQLKRAESMVHSTVPSQRNFGESEVDFSNRHSQAKLGVDASLEPYRKEVERREQFVVEANSIYESCLSAARTLRDTAAPFSR